MGKTKHVLRTSIDNEIYNDGVYLLKNVPILYKYLKSNYCISTLKSSKLTYSNPMSFNDPYDCYDGLIKFEKVPETYRKQLLDKYSSNPYFNYKFNFADILDKSSDDEIARVFREIALPTEKTTRAVTCFSEKPDNLLMWSHYAHLHTGVCLGFELKKFFLDLRQLKIYEPAIIRIKYVKDLESIDYFIDRKRAISNWLSIKSNHWKYEREIRAILAPVHFGGKNKIKVRFPKTVLTHVLLGSKITKAYEDKIVEICRKKYSHVKIYKMSLDTNRFRLIKKRLYF